MNTIENRIHAKRGAIKRLLSKAVPVNPSQGGMTALGEWKVLNKLAHSVRAWREGWDKGWNKWGK